VTLESLRYIPNKVIPATTTDTDRAQLLADAAALKSKNQQLTSDVVNHKREADQFRDEAARLREKLNQLEKPPDYVEDTAATDVMRELLNIAKKLQTPPSAIPDRPAETAPVQSIDLTPMAIDEDSDVQIINVVPAPPASEKNPYLVDDSPVPEPTADTPSTAGRIVRVRAVIPRSASAHKKQTTNKYLPEEEEDRYLPRGKSKFLTKPIKRRPQVQTDEPVSKRFKQRVDRRTEPPPPLATFLGSWKFTDLSFYTMRQVTNRGMLGYALGEFLFVGSGHAANLPYSALMLGNRPDLAELHLDAKLTNRYLTIAKLQERVQSVALPPRIILCIGDLETRSSATTQKSIADEMLSLVNSLYEHGVRAMVLLPPTTYSNQLDVRAKFITLLETIAKVEERIATFYPDWFLAVEAPFERQFTLPKGILAHLDADNAVLMQKLDTYLAYIRSHLKQ